MLNAVDQTGQNALVHAAKSGHGTTVAYLLSCETRKDQEFMLSVHQAFVGAAQAGNLTIMEYLLDTADLEVYS